MRTGGKATGIDAEATAHSEARGEGDPPNGWLRASENLDLLRELIGDTTSTDEQLLARLQPSDSGFRAEIYIPDPNVLGPGFKPTLAFKGSAGEVLGTDGARRHTASEDFLGNNFPQSVGLQTNYYDQAMDLAVLLRERGLDFDITGHSLGGGLAAAASAAGCAGYASDTRGTTTITSGPMVGEAELSRATSAVGDRLATAAVTADTSLRAFPSSASSLSLTPGRSASLSERCRRFSMRRA